MSYRRPQRPLPLRPLARHTPPSPAARPFARASGGAGLGLLPLYLLIALALVLTAGYTTLGRLLGDRMLPNVQLRGVAVGGMTPIEATTALRAQYHAWLRAPITLTDGEQRWTPTLAELGVTFDLERSVGDAYALGRGLNPLLSARQYYTAWRYGLELPLFVQVDEAKLRRYLLARASELDRRPRDAELWLVGTNVELARAATGRQLLVDDTARAIIAALGQLEPATIALDSRPLPPRLADEAVAPVALRLRTLLREPVTLQVGDRSWTWDRAALAELVVLERGAGTINARLDQQAIAERVDAIAREVTREPKEPKLRWENGALQIVEPGYDGASIDTGGSVALINAALWQEPREIALAGTVVRPQVTPENLASLGISELIAEGRSAFPGSANYRITNIANGARLIDGTLIPPGGQFAFNERVEPVDESNGFVPGLAIVNYRTQQEWGGGLCQVSTTVFRAAFWAGLPIDERHEHQFRIGWYEIYEPVGMDAAIFTGPGGDDLRFTNDTGHWLLLQTVLDPANVTLTVQVYGTRPNREVIQTPPVIGERLPAPTKPVYIDDPALPVGTLRHTDIAQEGLEVSVGRRVIAGDQVLREDAFVTRFAPWPNIYVRGTGVR
jgi:vancomycin resistance protein YoaR